MECTPLKCWLGMRVEGGCVLTGPVKCGPVGLWGWRSLDRCSSGPTWRTWIPPHTQHDLRQRRIITFDYVLKRVLLRWDSMRRTGIHRENINAKLEKEGLTHYWGHNSGYSQRIYAKVPHHLNKCFLTVHSSVFTCKFHMEFILWLQNLDVNGALWSEILHSPSSQNCLMVLRGKQDNRDTSEVHLLELFKATLLYALQCGYNIGA